MVSKTEPVQRLQGVEGSAVDVKARICSIIHGYLDGHPGADHKSRPATLIVLEFRFSTARLDRRVRRAEIGVNFAAWHDNNTLLNPWVHDFAPDGEYILRPDAENPSQIVPEKKNRSSDSAELEGEMALLGMSRYTDRSPGPPNGVVWHINESFKAKDGMPSLVQTAILLGRQNDQDKCEMKLSMKLTTSGLSFERMFGSGEQDIIINPTSPNMNPDDFDRQHLGNVDLTTLFKVMGWSQVLTELTGATEQPSRHAIQRALGTIARQQTREDKTRARESIQPITPGEYFFAELWSRDSQPAADASTTMATRVSKVGRALDGGLLKKYFPWVQEEPALPSTDPAEDTQRLPERKKICALIGLQSGSSGCQSPEQLDALSSEETFQSLREFFGLPTAFAGFRQNDGGIWLRANSDQSQDLAYLYQTPFDPECFWSLVLVTRENSATGAAVLHADKGTDLQLMLQEAQKYGSTGSNPLVILVLLFMQQVRKTSVKFKAVATKIHDIDTDLLAALEFARTHKNEIKVSDYGDLSHRIYTARMDVVELQRRREFEAQVGKTLQDDINDDLSLSTLVGIFTGVSASHELNVQSFPDRLESQRTVLYSIIAQQDAKVQFKLARETTKDSKAMKTLAVITILLLPGTFMATLFAVPDLLNFKPGQKSQIYWGVTVPATFVTIVAWWLWVRRSASHIPGDAEAGKNEKND